ncbi:hypothetical protein Cmtc_08690 [Cupriavidus sp. TKC]|uniref:hypothetical protein n=1 Tax=Cupriavidus sp. TKC TaxID=2880159 RepID=UPI0025A6AA4A|nr:hypothetical protein [Cupriavidus sp. TKC]GMG89649.1 hypothetical protein Cmtc_08690 [Cupriavidus sp. TKC]
MTDLFETITKADERTVPWPFPSDRKRAERRTLAAFTEHAQVTEAQWNSLAAKGTLAGTASDFSLSNEASKADIATCNVNILALDLATKCGWAYATRSGKRRGGTERFSSGKNQQNGQRWLAFRQWLCDVSREADGFHVVYYEDVRRHVSNLSARAYCGYLAILEAWCAINNVPMVGVGVGTVKKAWTGKGNATKDEMIAEATRRRLSVMDDNHADALAILDYAVKQEQ